MVHQYNFYCISKKVEKNEHSTNRLSRCLVSQVRAKELVKLLLVVQKGFNLVHLIRIKWPEYLFRMNSVNFI